LQLVFVFLLLIAGVVVVVSEQSSWEVERKKEVVMVVVIIMPSSSFFLRKIWWRWGEMSSFHFLKLMVAFFVSNFFVECVRDGINLLHLVFTLNRTVASSSSSSSLLRLR
jgi:hypothetical protein